MKRVKNTTPQLPRERRLSPWRVMLAIVLLTALGTSTVYGMKQWHATRSTASHDPWFAAYVDVTSTPAFPFDQIGGTSHRDAILSFVVASPKDGCTPTWGGAYTLDQAGDSLDLDRRIARLQQQKGSVAISFGGLKNHELALTCTDADKLTAAYRTVVDRYNVDTIDLDLENSSLTDKSAAVRRATAIATLQKERRSQGKNLAVWVTLPVAPQGLSQAGTDAVEALLKGDVDLAGINAMTMNYSDSKGDLSVEKASEKALTETVRQLGILYDRAGTHQNTATLWSKLGATPMIGQNDVADEVFRIKDAQEFNKFVRSHGLSRMSMWSANRDRECGDNYIDTKVVSDSCSGVIQEKYGFATALGNGFSGSLTRSSSLITKKEKVSTKQIVDDPATSPYQIWSEEGTYLQGTKVVWHHNVYEAKWWTQGDMPDNPVLQSFETPWDLVGPVLAGEKPIPQATLPDGTYPNWTGTDTYDTGQRILFNGVPYQAKWWNTGQSPAAASSNPNGSPWTPLTQKQINDIIAQAAN